MRKCGGSWLGVDCEEPYHCSTKDLIFQMVIIPLKNFKQGQLNFLNLILVLLSKMDWKRTKLKEIAETILLSFAEDDGLNEKKFRESNRWGHWKDSVNHGQKN